MSCSSRLLAVVVLAGGLCAPRTARADKAAADVAFAEAKRLMGQGKVAEACPKFQLSHTEDPQLGTLLNLADCHEQLGKFATAWAEFREAMELASNRGDEREAFARERSEKLAPRVSHVVLTKRGDSAGLRVLLDGRDVTALVGIAIPIDRGAHVIATRSDDGSETSKTIEIGRGRRKLELTVPFGSSREDDPVVPPAGQPSRKRRLIGLGIGAAGVVVTGIGAYFGKQAFGHWDDSRAFCDELNRCDAEGARLVDDARSAATTANILIGVGIGMLVTGTIVYLTAPRESTSTVTARAIVAPSVVGGALAVQF